MAEKKPKYVQKKQTIKDGDEVTLIVQGVANVVVTGGLRVHTRGGDMFWIDGDEDAVTVVKRG